MEVKDIFEMRKAGKTEEAYHAIQEIYAHHHGPHTNLCMFWCSSDMFRKAAKEKNAKEARQFLGSMVKIYPDIKDDRGDAARAISRSALAMDKMVKDFNLVWFMPWFNKLTDDDWRASTVNGHQIPSLGQQIVNHLMKDITTRDIDYVNSITDIFDLAVQKAPYNKENMRHYAQLSIILGKTEEARTTYKRLLRRHHDSYLYVELAKLIQDPGQKIALYCQAIKNQPREEFSAQYHLTLSLLLSKCDMKGRAAYELNRCVDIYKRHRKPLTPFIKHQQQVLANAIPVEEEDEQVLYDRSEAVINKMIAE